MLVMKIAEGDWDFWFYLYEFWNEIMRGELIKAGELSGVKIFQIKKKMYTKIDIWTLNRSDLYKK